MKRASRQTSALSSDNRRTSSGNVACLKATTDVPSVKFVPSRVVTQFASGAATPACYTALSFRACRGARVLRTGLLPRRARNLSGLL